MGGTKTHKGYIVIGRNGTPIYPTMSTNRRSAIMRMCGEYTDDYKKEWNFWKSQGFDVRPCVIIVSTVDNVSISKATKGEER